ncbi:unnamed protein product, partial [Laminaria digitata]
HPTVEALLERAAAGTRPSGHGDGRRIGLAIEVGVLGVVEMGFGGGEEGILAHETTDRMSGVSIE